MTESHKITIDGAGRLVVPKSLRDQLGLVPGRPLRAAVRDGCLELVPEPIDVDLVDHDGVLVIAPNEPVEQLSRADVRSIIESVRR